MIKYKNDDALIKQEEMSKKEKGSLEDEKI